MKEDQASYLTKPLKKDLFAMVSVDPHNEKVFSMKESRLACHDGWMNGWMIFYLDRRQRTEDLQIYLPWME